ncbi:MAG: PilZ domain-containing protein, partial [Gammaproteobacteria bacterium]|nr:PilZ domain-containing protein [Gammaproteobacteria bacterium]
SVQKLDHSLPINKYTFKANLDRLSRELQPLHNVIKSSSPNIAQYLATLDKKINLLGEYLIQDHTAENSMKLYQINIGAGGCSFLSDKFFVAGAMLELQMKLLPENMTIFSYARVKSCVHQNENTEQPVYKTAVEFEFMGDDVRDLIARHVLGKERTLINKS